jgi:hypothetical protein
VLCQGCHTLVSLPSVLPPHEEKFLPGQAISSTGEIRKGMVKSTERRHCCKCMCLVALDIVTDLVAEVDKKGRTG